ncbi:SpoIIE family protein phosphatase [bacterium AH-315-C20]|nr:SpoIIE family protein phosphatase [bacterium AH-315-C20]
MFRALVSLVDKLKKFSPIIGFFLLVICACEGADTDVVEVEEASKDTTLVEADSIPTGIPYPYRPILHDKDTLIEPLPIPAGFPIIDSAHQNVKLIENPKITLVASNLPTYTPGIDRPPADTVEALGDTVKIAYTKPAPSAPPNYKDLASYNIQYLDVDQGLSASYIMSIEEDSRGNLWFSTWPEGVCMYDGRFFIQFNANNKLISNYVWSICEDAEGRIWFGTDGAGISVYDGNVFIIYTDEQNSGKPSNMPDLMIRDIITDQDGHIWFSHREGLTKFQNDRFITYTTEQGLSSNELNDLHLCEDGKILIATDLGVNIFDGESFTHYTENEGLHSNNITAVYEDEEKNLWFGSGDKGVCLYDGYSFFTFTEENGLSADIITDINSDEYGNIWIATEYGGLSMYDHKHFTHFTTEQGLGNDHVKCIHAHSDGNMWFGTYGAGVNKYNERSFQNYTEKAGLPSPIIRDIIEDREGNLWFGHDFGVTKYNGKMFHHYDASTGLGENQVRTMIHDSRGNIWFGTGSGGAVKFDGENFYHYGAENGLIGQTIFTIFEDSDSNIWFGTNSNGVTKYDGENFYQFLFGRPETNETCRAIAEDADGNIWFGSNGGGAFKYDGENMTVYAEKEGIAYPSILSFMSRKNGDFWIGTEHSGAFHFTDDTLIPYSTKQGLSNDIVWSMVEDLDQDIWITTERGLNMLSFDDSGEYIVTQFGKLDGLKGVDFYPNSVCLDDQYRFWWGSGKALTMLDLNKYERILKPPKVTIIDVELHHNFVDFRKLKDTLDGGYVYFIGADNEYSLEGVEFDNVKPFTNLPTNLILPFSLNYVTFHFSSLDWPAPHKIRYQYRLSPLEDSWSPILDEAKATYTNIPEGEYTFMLRAIGGAQEWSEIIEYKLIIQAPWYRTTLAKISYVISGILLIIIAIYFRTRQLIQQKKKLEETINERTIEVVQQKEIVELKNKEITDSITYAKRIQEAILPSKSLIKQIFDEWFILYKPKDIVAGDFYWLEQKGNKLLIASADCTGHGVPGAMVSVVCNNALNRAVREFGLIEPGKVLNKVRDLVIDAFDSGGKDIKDGMDIALVSIDWSTNTLEYSGANNSLYLFSNGEMKEFRGDKQPIGKYSMNKDFANHKIDFKKGDCIYVSTDGYMDQFGGPKHKKFKYAPFIQLLAEMQSMTFPAQKEHMDTVFEEWKGDLDQIDDVCVIGIKL